MISKAGLTVKQIIQNMKHKNRYISHYFKILRLRPRYNKLSDEIL